ncbi:MAG: ABC transporter ATP-binding protein, partial [Dehalococcoidia bacterium]|nr:ABC transporter ATP-binding protein [Dehalococcoidia bacterium]
MLEVRGLEAGYGGIVAVKGIDLDVGENEIVTLIGANGAGKTTTLKAISGLVRARAGSITFAQQSIEKHQPHDIVRLGISHVPEGRGIFARLTVYENLQLGSYVQGPRAAVEDLPKVFDLFPRLKERASQTGGTLSGGEQQMLAIGRALMARPRLLLMDEPSMGLSPLLVET